MPSQNPIDQFAQQRPQVPPQQNRPQPNNPAPAQNPGPKPDMANNIAKLFACYVKAGIQLLVWSLIAIASLAAAYLTIRAIWSAVKMILTAIGADGGY